MKKIFGFTILIILYLLLLPTRAIITNENINKSRFAKDHIIVKLKKDLVLAAGNSTIKPEIKLLESITGSMQLKVTKIKELFPTDRIHNIELAQKYGLDKFYLVYLDKYKDLTQICKEIEKNRSVEFSEPDFIGEAAAERSKEFHPMIVPNDEFYNRQWGLHNDGSIRTTTGKIGKQGGDMDIERGWEIETGSEDVIVAVLDSGCKLDHPELADRLWINPKEKRNGRDEDGNGFIDDVNGWNFAYDNANVKDDGGHGTNICGTIGASTNNSIGYAGVDWKCKLMICKDLDNENLGEYSWWSAALYYAANNGAKIINMSEGGFDYSKTLATAVNYANDAGCFIVASMMNKNNDDEYYPAALPNVFAVGATDTDDGRCRQFTWGGGSNWGKQIAVVAPGNRIYGLDYKDDSNFDVYWSGTSQATAYVSGIASLLLGQDSSRTNKNLKDIITSTAKDQIGDPREDTPGWDQYYGFGRVDIYAALTYNKATENNHPKEDNRGSNYDNPDKIKVQDNQAKAADRKSSPSPSEDNRAHKVEHR